MKSFCIAVRALMPISRKVWLTSMFSILFEIALIFAPCLVSYTTPSNYGVEMTPKGFKVERW